MVRASHVVVINDSPEFLDTISEILGACGYRVTPILGTDAWDSARLASLQPDLVMLDLVVRDPSGALASGWDLLRSIRASDGLASVPVIVNTGNTPELRRREDDLAAIDATVVLPKPFSLDQLEAVVAGALGRSAREAL